jgi:hypothetical protein
LAQQIWQLSKDQIACGGARAVEQPGAAALNRWVLGNQFWREYKIKIAEGEVARSAGQSSRHGA